ncbi:MAG: SDR family oxidoreductase [Rhizobiaceae bacterium]|nr:SDR family oxidoreductase [Rhizobiaceae bacterium]
MADAQGSKEGGRLAGRRIALTGAASGIGLATAKLFAAEGASLALIDLQASALADAAAATGGRPFTADITSETSISAAIDAGASAMGGIDGLVHVAGVTTMAPFEKTDLVTWQRMIDVNLTGTFLTCKAALRWLQKEESATIVTIASGVAIRPGAGGASYGAAKAGVVMLTKAIALEHAPKIRANIVCPGGTDTPMSRQAMSAFPEEQQKAFVRNNYAMQRFGRPEEIAHGILYLTGRESSWVTGIALPVDGGRTFH